jgi:hypothetical protein
MRHIVIVVLGLGLSLMSGGCEQVGRGLTRLYGIKTDPFPGPCAPESVRTGQCVPVTQQHQSQGEHK